MSGYTDGTFRPNEAVTYPQAIKVMLMVLGYYVYAYQRGGYPNGFLSTASGLGLLTGLDMVEPLTWDTFAGFLVDVVNTPILKQIGVSSGNYDTYQEAGTLLEEVHGITRGTGVVTANAATSLTGESSVGKNSVAIDYESYLTTAVPQAADLLGYAVEYYYREESANDRELVSIRAQRNRNEILELSSDAISKFENQLLTYEIDGHSETVYCGTADVITNQVADRSDLSNLFSRKNSFFQLLDRDLDGSYDVIFVECYINYVSGGTVGSSMRITDKYGQKGITLDSDVTYTIELEDGTPIELAQIKEWDIISVYADKMITETVNGVERLVVDTENAEYYRLVVSQNSTTGKVEELIDENARMQIRVAGSLYYVSPSYMTSGETEFKLLQEGTFYLDAQNEVAAFNLSGIGMKKFGILLGVDVGKGIDNLVRLRIYTAEDEQKDIPLAETVYYNGSSLAQEAEDIAALEELQSPQLVAYQLNGSGEISRLNTVQETVDPSDSNYLRKDGAEKNRLYKIESKTFSGECYMTAKTTIFTVPRSVDDSGQYIWDVEGIAVKNLDSIRQEEQYICEFYNIDDMMETEAVLLFPAGGTVDASAPVVIVDRIGQGLDAEDNVVKMLTGYQNGKKVQLYAENDSLFDGLERGDAVQYARSGKGEVTSISKVFDASQPAYGDPNGFNARFQTITGLVTKSTGSSVMIDISGAQTMRRLDVGTVSTYIYDTEKDRVSVATSSEIEKDDLIFVYLSYTVAQEVLIVR